MLLVLCFEGMMLRERVRVSERIIYRWSHKLKTLTARWKLLRNKILLHYIRNQRTPHFVCCVWTSAFFVFVFCWFYNYHLNFFLLHWNYILDVFFVIQFLFFTSCYVFYFISHVFSVLCVHIWLCVFRPYLCHLEV